MFTFLLKIFDTSDFPARWTCGQWSLMHGWTHIVSDFAIFGAYAAIPLVLAYFVWKRKDTPFLPIFWLFAAFLLACGIEHFIEATIFWHPWYRLSALSKVITAFVSWATVIALIPVIPRALSLPGLALVNQQLEAEVQERKRVEERLRQYEAIIESSSDAIIGKALDGTITSWNPGAESIYGYNSKEAIGQSIFVLIPPGDPRDSETNLEIISKGERIDSFETRRCCPLAFTRLQPP